MQMSLFNHCCQCGEEHAAVATVIHTVNFHRSTKTYYFCGETCRQHFALNQIRRLEGAPVDDPAIDV